MFSLLSTLVINLYYYKFLPQLMSNNSNTKRGNCGWIGAKHGNDSQKKKGGSNKLQQNKQNLKPNVTNESLNRLMGNTQECSHGRSQGSAELRSVGGERRKVEVRRRKGRLWGWGCRWFQWFPPWAGSAAALRELARSQLVLFSTWVSPRLFANKRVRFYA